MPKNEVVHAKNSRRVVPKMAHGIIDPTDRQCCRYRADNRIGLSFPMPRLWESLG